MASRRKKHEASKRRPVLGPWQAACLSSVSMSVLTLTMPPARPARDRVHYLKDGERHVRDVQS
jgi:hypothetical protein